VSLLTIVQAAADRISIPRPSAVIGSSDQQVRQLSSLADQEGRELARRAMWQALTKEKTFTSIASETQTGAIPSDFDRMVPGTFFNRTRKRMVTGPLSSQEWQDLKGRTVVVYFDAFRIRNDALLLQPTPPAGETYAFEYVSMEWCESSDGATDRSAWAADTDVAKLDEEIITLGVIWRFLRMKGLDYSEAFRTYEVQVTQMIARDGAKRSLNMASGRDYRQPRVPQFPDGNWNL